MLSAVQSIDCRTIYRLTNKHITIEESTNTFQNSTLCINKVSITTTLEDIEVKRRSFIGMSQ